MRVAAIDLGTNSFLCLIAEVDERHQTLNTIFDVCRVVRVGEKIHQNRYFLPEALKRAEKCLEEFSSVIKKYKVEKVVATATSAARDAANGGALIQLGKDRGIPIHIIGGPREAQLSFEGAISGIEGANQKKVLVVDVGGGSTELIFREPTKEIKGQSFDVGCVRLTEMFLKADPIKPTEYQELYEYGVKTVQAFGKVSPDVVVGVAGTPTTLACVAQEIDFDESKVEGYILTRSKILELSKILGQMPLDERKKVRGLEPLRADVIIAGCALLNISLALAQRDEMRVSTRGLRYGVALHHEEFK